MYVGTVKLIGLLESHLNQYEKGEDIPVEISFSLNEIKALTCYYAFINSITDDDNIGMLRFLVTSSEFDPNDIFIKYGSLDGFDSLVRRGYFKEVKD